VVKLLHDLELVVELNVQDAVLDEASLVEFFGSENVALVFVCTL